MVRVYLIRHGVAFDRDRRRWPDDRERPLTPQGMKKFGKAAAGLKRIAEAPGCVLTSPLIRARQTADILSKLAKWPRPIEASELAPGRTPAQALALIRKRTHGCIALVGHEPNLSELLAVSIGGPAVRLSCEFKKGGVACLTFAAPRAGQASLDWLLTPRVLRGLARKG